MSSILQPFSEWPLQEGHHGPLKAGKPDRSRPCRLGSMGTLRDCVRLSIGFWFLACLLLGSAHAAEKAPWQAIKYDVISRVQDSQRFADELESKIQQMAQTMKVLQGQADQLHTRIGDLERRIEQAQPRVDEMKGALEALYDRQQSTLRHRNETTERLTQEQIAVRALFDGHARCMHDAWIFEFFCGPPPSEQAAVQVRLQQMEEWQRLINDDSRSLETIGQQLREQYGNTLEENYALTAAKTEQTGLEHAMTLLAKERSRVRASWLCISPRVGDIRSRIAHIETLTEEQTPPFIRAALQILESLETDIQAFRQNTPTEQSMACPAA